MAYGSDKNKVTAGNVEGNADLQGGPGANDNSVHVGDVAQDLTVSGSPVATTQSLAIQLLQLWLREASQRGGRTARCVVRGQRGGAVCLWRASEQSPQPRG